jgi:hypothetical protein
MGMFNAQSLANTAWAFATAGMRAPGLFAAVAVHYEQRCQRMGMFNAQSLANTAWAFAIAGVTAPGLLPHSRCTLSGIWARSTRRISPTRRGRFRLTAGVCAPGLFAALAMHSEQRMGTFNAQDLANTAWAFATAGVRAPGLFAALAMHAEHRMGMLNAQNLANTAWAFAAMYLLDAPAMLASVRTDSAPALHPWLLRCPSWPSCTSRSLTSLDSSSGTSPHSSSHCSSVTPHRAALLTLGSGGYAPRRARARSLSTRKRLP